MPFAEVDASNLLERFEGIMSPRLPRITAVDLLRALRRAGWEIVRQRGSYARLTHATKQGRVTIPRHTGDIIEPTVLLAC